MIRRSHRLLRLRFMDQLIDDALQVEGVGCDRFSDVSVVRYSIGLWFVVLR